ncbi:AAA family ATPase [Aeromonas media]|uniref:AAA family ATPase n=1 Tax=Aeromonas media TaxID=651 RepID=A0AAP6L2V0_AERME|nr:AAA family ATPase [Aeromonas media]MDX7924071.1 AAA family ATPase [Aeromonas media]
MSVIRKLKIKHFKSIWDDTIDLGRLNVFIGTNGAGKSNILEAIAVASASVEGGIDYPKLHKRGARLSAPEIFRSSFKNKKRNQTFSISIEMDDVKYDFSIRSKEGFPYLTEAVYDRFGHKLSGRGQNGSDIAGVKLPQLLKDKSIVPFTLVMSDSKSVLGLSALEQFGIYFPSTPILRGSSEDSSRKNPLGLYGGRLAESLDEIVAAFKESPENKKELQRFFRLFDWFKSFGATKKLNPLLLGNDQLSINDFTVSYKDSFMRTDFNDLSAYDVSEGALYVLFVLVLMTHKKTPNIFALDNIDSALNPGLVRNLMGHIIEIIDTDKDKQVFMTTHNPMTLDAIDLFNEEHRLFVVERMPDGQTKTRRIAPPEGITKEIWDDEFGGMKLSDIWLSGAIGGLPKGF